MGVSDGMETISDIVGISHAGEVVIGTGQDCVSGSMSHTGGRNMVSPFSGYICGTELGRFESAAMMWSGANCFDLPNRFESFILTERGLMAEGFGIAPACFGILVTTVCEQFLPDFIVCLVTF